MEDPARGRGPLCVLTRKETALSGLAFLFLALAFFHDMVGGRYLFGGGDFITFFLPYRKLWLEQVADFTFPLWNPYILSGTPLFATLQPAILYPLSLLFIAFPFVAAVNLTVILHYALAGWFMYLLLRAMRCGRGAGIVAAVVFMFGGYLITVRIYLSTFLPVVWVPLLLLCFFAGLLKRDRRWALAAAAVGACMFLSGGVETCYQVFGLLILFALFPRFLFEREPIPDWRWRATYLGVFVAVFFGLIAVQFLPTWELSRLTERAGGLAFSESTRWAMKPQDLLQFFLLDPYGYLSRAQEAGENQLWLRSLYMGAIPFLLARFFVHRGGVRAWTCLLIVIVSVLTAMGPEGGLYNVFYDVLPFFDRFRYPVKFILPAVVVIALLAGWGWDRFVRDAQSDEDASRRRARGLIVLALLGMTTFALVDAYGADLRSWMTARGWAPPRYNDPRINLFNVKRLLAFASLFCLFLFGFLRASRKRELWLGAALGVLALDVIFSGFGFYHKVPVDEYQRSSPLTKFIRQDRGVFRIYIADNAERGKDGRVAAMNVRGNLIMGPKVPLPIRTETGIYQADGWAVMRVHRYLKFRKILRVPPLEDRLNLLSLANVKYIVSRDPLKSDKLKRLEFHDPGHPELKVYENTARLPRAFLAPHCTVIGDEKRFIAHLLDKRLDFSRRVLFESPPEGFECGNGEGEAEAPAGTVPQGSVTDLHLGYDTVTLTATTPVRQWLVLADSYYPGWKVEVDGQPAPLYRADYVYRAVAVPPGTHTVRFEYKPWTFRIGAGVTLLTLVLCGGFLLKPKRRHAEPSIQTA